MTTLYKIQKTVNGESSQQGDAKPQADIEKDIADLRGYMARQGAQIVVFTNDSFIMVLSRIVTRYSMIAVSI
jgi:hypothetical protein